MIHPAHGQRYDYRYILPGSEADGWYTWDSWLISYEPSAKDDLKRSIDRLHSDLPGIQKSKFMWFNNATNQWEQIYVPGLTINQKYALFSED